MRISAERENSNRTQLAATSLFSQHVLMPLNGHHVHNPEWVYSIFHFLPDGGIVRLILGDARVHTHKHTHPRTIYIYTHTQCYFKDDNRSVKAGLISSFS